MGEPVVDLASDAVLVSRKAGPDRILSSHILGEGFLLGPTLSECSRYARCCTNQPHHVSLERIGRCFISSYSANPALISTIQAFLSILLKFLA